jgi:AraC family transcriptional activator of pobA
MTPARSTRRRIPTFSLYGEQSTRIGQTDPLHIEDIQSRSRKYLWKIGTHRHAGFCQLVYVTSGPVVVDLEEIHREFAGPVVIVIPAATVHGFLFRAQSQGYVLTLDLDRLLSVTSAPQQSTITSLFSVARTFTFNSDLPQADRIEQLLAALLLEFRQPDSLVAPVCGWLACAALWTLAAMAATMPAVGVPAGYDVSRLRRFRLLVESHYLEHWPVERYAQQLGISESSLNRLCQRLNGSTAFDVIQQRLALEARRRLVYVAASVAALAAELGFRDPAYFCRFFRKQCGMSPTEFRRRHGDG